MSRSATFARRPLSPISAYAESSDAEPPWHDRLADALLRRVGYPLRSALRWPAGELADVARRAAAHATPYQAATDEALRALSAPLRTALRREGLTAPLAAQGLALWRELAHRALGYRAHDVQLMGAMTLLRGRLCEMATGEGKTLTAALAAGTAAMAGLPVHVITVNDYLAERDASAMRALFGRLGLSVGLVVEGMSPDQRRAAYACDLCYCSNKELAFDYLKDRVALGRHGSRLQMGLAALAQGPGPRLLLRGLHFAILDEADSILIDEARTPLILSAAVDDDLGDEVQRRALDLASCLIAGVHYRCSPLERRVDLLPAGLERAAAIDAGDSPAWASPRGRRAAVELALAALHLYDRDRHYLVRDRQVQIIDEYTGRVMPDRSWQDGLHQMIELKESCPPSAQRVTLARITYQRLFRRYLMLSGMTGTAREVAHEIAATYGLRTVVIPPHRPVRRRHLPAQLFATEIEKWQAVAAQVKELAQGQRRPVLLGTRSVEASDRLSRTLTAAGLPHALLNARQDQDEAEVVARAGEAGRVTVATNMAGRGTDIRLGPGVAERGGLHVILTEFHASARVDRQLFGRCARQGDPGSVQLIASCEDELVQQFARFLIRWGSPGAANAPLRPSLLLACMRRLAQARAGWRDAAQRRRTLSHDRAMDAALAFTGTRE
jgi:preprotein translocase subunit SecA